MIFRTNGTIWRCLLVLNFYGLSISGIGTGKNGQDMDKVLDVYLSRKVHFTSKKVRFTYNGLVLI